jgi:ATP-dependent RNA helicase DeaD
VNEFQFDSLPEQIVQCLARLNITSPTPIQQMAIPVALAGKDILGSAQTGTGKTAAFALPAIVKLMENPDNHVLVLTPTREIATQVLKAFETFIDRKSGIFMCLIIGGEPMGKQLAQLKRGVNIVIGTPGRVNDHLRRGSLSLKKTNYLVLDETDRMLDMGFGIQIDDILEHMNEEKQTLLFSATMPKEIERIAQRYLKNPERIAIGTVNAAAPLIKQETHNVKETDKYDKLREVINGHSGSAVIFAKTQFGAEKLALRLAQDGYSTDMLHGGLRQNKRERVVKAFQTARFDILVATDIAARGLDIPHLKMVINYDLPQSPEDYIHRIGRTGRAGAEGTAVSLVSSADTRKWRAIEQLLNPNAKSSSSEYRGDRGERSGGFGGGRSSSRSSSGGGYGRSSEGRSDRPSSGGFGRSSEGRSDRPRSDAPRGDFARSDRPRSDAPRGDFARSDRPRSDAPRGDFARSDRPRSDAPRGDFARSDRPRSDAPRGDFARSDRPRSDAPRGDFARSDRPRSDAPRGDFARSDRPRSDRPSTGGFGRSSEGRSDRVRSSGDFGRPSSAAKPARKWTA